MGWERRKTGKLYLYVSRRDGSGKVVKTYVAHGPQAQAAAQALAQRKADCRAVQDAQDRLEAADGLTRGLDVAATVLMEAALLAAGFHRVNYGKWRRRRYGHGWHRTAATAGRAD